jgi:peptidoglycan/xylan/chitin deacetylase (PgdA/CDA1 family)
LNIKHLAVATTDKIGILGLYSSIRKRLNGSQLAVFTYHRIGPKTDNWSLSPFDAQIFKQQIEFFSRNYEIIQLDDLIQRLDQGKSPPPQAVAITFDDGYLDVYSSAFPILAQYHVPATVFLATGYIGSDRLFWWDKVNYILQNTPETSMNLGTYGIYSLSSAEDRLLGNTKICEWLKKIDENTKNEIIQTIATLGKIGIPEGMGKKLLLSWDQVKEMSANNISFGAHTVNHPILTNVSLEQARQEIKQSRSDIEDRLQKKVYSFAYPSGCYNDRIIDLVKDSGYHYALSVFPNKLLSRSDNRFALCRITAPLNMNILKLDISGLLGDYQNISKSHN